MYCHRTVIVATQKCKHYLLGNHFTRVVDQSCGVVAADFMGPLTVINLGNHHIIIVGGHFTKHIETAALPSIETTLIGQVFLDKVVFRHGAPQRFLTDGRTNIRSKLMEQLCKELNISNFFYVKLPPLCDSSVELINAVTKQIITMHAASDHKVWDIYLPSATYVYNTILSKTSGDAPFFWPITET